MGHMFSYLAAHLPTWLRLLLGALCQLLDTLTFDVVFNMVIMTGFVPSYVRQLDRLYATYEKNPLAIHRPVLSARPFFRFLQQYMKECQYSSYTCIAIILANTVHLSLATVRQDLERHLILQVLVIISMTQALAGLYLNLVYMNTLSMVTTSCRYTRAWVEGAMATSQSKFLNTAVVLSTPQAWSTGAIISFALSRIIAGLLWSATPDSLASKDHRDVVMGGVVVYIIFVAAQTMLVARVFQSLKGLTGAISS